MWRSKFNLMNLMRTPAYWQESQSHDQKIRIANKSQLDEFHPLRWGAHIHNRSPLWPVLLFRSHGWEPHALPLNRPAIVHYSWHGLLLTGTELPYEHNRLKDFYRPLPDTDNSEDRTPHSLGYLGAMSGVETADHDFIKKNKSKSCSILWDDPT